MKRHSSPACAALALTLATFALATQAQPPNNGEIQQLADRWTQAYNTHDGEALAELYLPDAALLLHGQPTVTGREAIQAYWEQDFEEGNPITVLTVTHSISGIDMMLVHGNYQVINRTDGTPLGTGRFAHIWFVDQDGEWKLDRDLWNEPFEPYADQ